MKLVNSLFTRIYLVVLVSALSSVLIILLVILIQYRSPGFSSGFYSAAPAFLKRNAVLLDSPPTGQQIDSLSDRLGIDIYYIGDGIRLATADDPDITRLAEESMGKNQVQGFYKRKFYAGFWEDQGYLFFYGNLLLNVERLRGLVIVLLSTAVLSLVISLFLIRMMLSPLKSLDRGVASLKSGNLNYRVESTRKDELGDLAEGFNLMADRIQRMVADKEQLMLDVSHELKTPITRMKISLEFLEDEAVRASLKEDLDEMDIKVQELLTSARLDTPYGVPRKETFEIAGFLEQIAGSYQKQQPGIVLQQAAYNLSINADRELLRTACKNIIENALRYSRKDSEPVEIKYSQDSKGTTIEFRDHGIGIPEKDQASVFEPFYRVDRSRDRKSGGSGLGFYLVNKIVKSHGGTVSLSSKPDEGTKVGIFIPGE